MPKVIVAAVVVTRNRPQLLQRAVWALLSQSQSPDSVIVVDNASTNTTTTLFQDGPFAAESRVVYLRRDRNEGGAGGFSEGIAYAIGQGADWVWVMDDDAVPNQDALQKLLGAGLRSDGIYAAATLVQEGEDDELVWPLACVVEGRQQSSLMRLADLPNKAVSVLNTPFLGMMVHRDLVDRIGLPDKGFFVSGDDAEYCARARAAGAEVYVVPDAVVRHPRVERICLPLGGRRLCVLKLSPWRRYYDTRNRLIIARRYFGYRLWTEALPGTLFRWVLTLLVQTERMEQSRAFLRGIRDGLAGRTGILWPPP